MEKHAGQEGPVVVHGKSHVGGPLGVRVACGHDAEQVEQALEALFGQRDFQQKHATIRQNDRPGGDRRIAAGNRVVNRDHRVKSGLRQAWSSWKRTRARRRVAFRPRRRVSGERPPKFAATRCKPPGCKFICMRLRPGDAAGRTRSAGPARAGTPRNRPPRLPGPIRPECSAATGRAGTERNCRAGSTRVYRRTHPADRAPSCMVGSAR